MPIPTIEVYSADGTRQEVSQQSPLPVTGGEGGMPMITISGTVAVTGPTQLVAAPGAGSRVVVSSFVLQNESATATTIILQAGTTNRWRILGQNQGDGLAMAFSTGREWRLPANTALQIALSGNNSCGYSIAYFVERI